MPVSSKDADPVKGFLDPAIKGTTEILKSIKAFAPSVKRVVLTSSSAAMLNPAKHEKLYDESSWAPYTWEDALKPENAYTASKVSPFHRPPTYNRPANKTTTPPAKKFSEKAAWSFMDDENPTFDLAVVNNTYTFGPVQRHLATLDAVNLSNARIRDLVLGRMKDRLEPTFPVFTWVDVRDVALAHVRAATTPFAGGKRFYVVGGHFSNKRIADVIRREHPELAGRLPGEDEVDDLPGDVYQFDNTRSREVLGLEYKDLGTSVKDTVDSLLECQARNK